MPATLVFTAALVALRPAGLPPRLLLASPVSIDPCSLLTAAEAGTALGGTVNGEIRSSFFNKDNCEFRLQTNPAHRVVITVTKEPVSPQTFRRNRQVLALGLEMTVPELPGIGDAAYSAGRTLTVLKGTTVVEIDITKVLGESEAQEAVNLTAAKELMSKVLARLPESGPPAGRAV